MNTDIVITGEIVLDDGAMNATEARSLTDRIRKTLTIAHDLITAAYTGRAWVALGYETWDAYCAGELAEARMVRLDREQRREIVAEMREAGMSTRAIASGIGVGHGTVQRDLPTAPSGAVGAVTGVNGKTYSAARTPQPRRRRPLPDAYREAVDELQRSALRIARLHGDDRFGANRETVRNNRAELMRVAGIVADALMDLGDAQ